MDSQGRARSKAVVLVSGGLDSCVVAAVARRSHDLALLHLQYGQRTEARELRAFHAIADHFGTSDRMVSRLGHLKEMGGSALTDPARAVPAGDLDRREIPPTYVPFRNGNFLSVAVSWAEVLGVRKVYIGAVEEDGSGYPDCRAEFFRAFDRVIALGTRPDSGIRVEAPLVRWKKARIVGEGIRLGAPLHLTWSCYRYEDRACGTCDSCLLRLRAFQEAGKTDPLPYRTETGLPSP